MRRFDAEYLRETRRGMWSDDREALDVLDVGPSDDVLDVGCGTGALTRVLAEETDGRVVGLDADRDLLRAGSCDVPVVVGDARSLPFADDSFDLVVCQALLVNLFDPERAVREFARVASGRIAAIEPDNERVAVESTVDAEPRLERRAREAYLDGVETDVALGPVPDLFERTGLGDVRVRRYDHTRTIEPPYGEAAMKAARRKATGVGLDGDRATILAGGLVPEEYDDLRADWRAMGRDVVTAMQEGEYRREETVPFFVTVGEV
ncbi:MAG: class I SAM-dependent methyltransferase [Halanaeroarchaeum sp.]